MEPNYKTGDAITAEVINDVITKANTAIGELQDAKDALSKADGALTKATNVEMRANNGEFNGKDGVMIQGGGMFGFRIEEYKGAPGHLMLYYDEKYGMPNFNVTDGNLTLTVSETED